MKQQVNRLEKKSKTKRVEYEGLNIWKEAEKGTLINIVV
ncbi:hypothetical protein J2S78_003234 [Salibacterium salarium]|nr:hypothetical protein [Salibacterium salarium]